MNVSIDAMDRRILAQLQRDAGASVARVAEAVGLSPSPCWRRIRRLEEAGVLRRRVAVLDREALGFGILAFVHVKLNADGRQSLASFESAVRTFPEVLECHITMGEVDFLLKVVARDIPAFERFWRERLSVLPGVQELNSTVAMGTVKESGELPLGEGGTEVIAPS